MQQEMRKIDAMIIGAQKAGTTALKNLLGDHSMIHTHPHIEFGYFSVTDTEYDKLYADVVTRYFGKDIPNRLLLAKHSNFYRAKGQVERLFAHNPGCRLIFVIRNPVERAFSSYLMGKRKWFHGDQDCFWKSIEKWKNGEEDIVYAQFLSLGLYDEALKRIKEYFPANQLLLIRYERLKNDLYGTLAEVTRFLEIEPFEDIPEKAHHNVSGSAKSERFQQTLTRLSSQEKLKSSVRKLIGEQRFQWIVNYLDRFNTQTEKKEALQASTAKLLHEFYQPSIKNLEEMTGMDFSSWKGGKDNP